MKSTHWQYVKGYGLWTDCPKCGRKGYVYAARNFDQSLCWRTVHNKEQGKPRTCWGLKLTASLPIPLRRGGEVK